MKKSFWQAEWQNIQFRTLNVPLSIFKRPASGFYDAFYREVFLKYESFEALPLEWRKNKADTARAINSIIGDVPSVLSVGCGLGFVEKSLLEMNPILEIDTFDFSDVARRWLKKIKGVRCLTELDSAEKYKFIYTSQLLYALSDEDIAELAGFVSKHLQADGKFMTVDTSLNPSENTSQQINTRRNLATYIKSLLYPLYFIVLKKGAVQFWGWHRDDHEIIKMFENNGLTLVEKLSSAGQSFLVFQCKNGLRENG